MRNSRREFLKTSGAVALGAAASSCKPAAESAPASHSTGMLAANPNQPAPATYDRLPLEWHQATVKRFQERLLEKGLDGALITDPWNIIYLTGLFFTTTERPFACFIPARELRCTGSILASTKRWCASWWFTDGDYYYDFPHAEGGYPDQGTVVVGPAVDLVEWQLRGIEKRGFGDKGIGLDRNRPPRKSSSA